MMSQGKEAWGPVLMMGILQSSLVACLPWLIERTGLSAGTWSVILSVGMLPVLLGAPVWGRLVDLKGPRLVSGVASVMVLAGFALLLMVLVTGVQGVVAAGFLVVARLAHGIGAGGVFPAAQRLAISGRAPQEWSYRLSRLQMAVHAGRLAGPALIAMAAWLGMMTVLLLAGVLALLLALNGNRGRAQRLDGAASQIESGRPQRLPWMAGWPFYLMALLLTAWVGAVQFMLGPVLTDMADVPPELGASLTAGALVLASIVGLIFGPLVHLRARGGVVLLLLWGSALLGATVALSKAQNLYGLYGGIAALAFGAAVLTPWYGSLLRQCHPDAQGEVAGRLTSIHTLGYIIGVLAGGWLLETRSVTPLTGFEPLAPALILLAVWVLASSRRGRTND